AAAPGCPAHGRGRDGDRAPDRAGRPHPARLIPTTRPVCRVRACCPARRASGRDRGELPAGAVDLRPARVADRGGDAVGAQPPDELPLDLGPRGGPLRPRGRVERDRVDVYPAATPGEELLGQQVGPPGVVVDVPDEGVLDADPATGRLEVAPRRVEGLVDLPPRVDRDQLVTQLVVRGV